jgi:thiol-disulfide isomerase/thioredoxin
MATALAMVALVVGACAGAEPGEDPTAAPTGTPVGPASPTLSPQPSSTGLASPAPSAAASPPPAGGGAASPSPSANPAAEALADEKWATLELTDVATGETFTLAGLAGKPLFVEAMAIWCTNCREQQARFTEAFSQLLPGMAEYVVLTVDPSETAQELARYRAQRGFTGRYAVAGRELSRALEAAFGPNVLNPPSVPLIFVAPDGTVDFRTGPESVQHIVERAGA